MSSASPVVALVPAKKKGKKKTLSFRPAKRKAPSKPSSAKKKDTASKPAAVKNASALKPGKAKGSVISPKRRRVAIGKTTTFGVDEVGGEQIQKQTQSQTQTQTQSLSQFEGKTVSKSATVIERRRKRPTSTSSEATAGALVVAGRNVDDDGNREHELEYDDDVDEHDEQSKDDQEADEHDEEQAAKTAAEQEATAAKEAAKAAAAQKALHDKALLEKLQGEDPTGTRLMAFCGPFKSKKKRVRRKKKKETQPRGAAAGANRNNADAETAEAAAANAPVNASTNDGPAVQIVDGEIVLQESSLVVQPRKTVEQVEAEFGQVIEEDATMAIIGANYSSFKTKNVSEKAPHHWQAEETKLFYHALRQLGTDFCSMEVMFPERSRKQLKRKYSTELNKNPKLIDWALHPKNQLELDISAFNIEITDEEIQKSIEDQNKPIVVEQVAGQNGNVGADDDHNAGEHAAEGARASHKSLQEQWEEVFEDADDDREVEAEQYRKQQQQENEHEQNDPSQTQDDPSQDATDPFQLDAMQADPMLEGDNEMENEMDFLHATNEFGDDDDDAFGMAEQPPQPQEQEVLSPIMPGKSNKKGKKKPKFRTAPRRKK